jgi:O-antigen/teichoic acid export membrane protein
MQGTKGKSVRGIIWSAIDRIAAQAIQFLISVLLARLLLPEDFAAVAIVLVFINILQTINESGFGVALVQNQQRDETDFSTVYYFNIALGFVLYGILFVTAPLISAFFDQDLTLLLRLLGINLIATSFVVVHRAILLIKIDFKTQAKATTIGVLVSGVAGLAAARWGYGVYSLAVQSVLNTVISSWLLWYFTRWTPGASFSYDRFKKIVEFAWKLVTARLINDVFQNLYTVVIGKFFPLRQVGFYNRAVSFQYLSTNLLTQIVQRVSMPVLCEQQTDDVKMRQTHLNFMMVAALPVFPLLFGLFVLAEPLVVVLLTAKWLPVAYMLQILCPVGLLFVINTFNLNIFNATGRTDLALKVEIYKKVIMVLLILVSLQLGFEALLYSQIVVAVIELLVNTWYTRKLIGLTLWEQLRHLWPVVLSSAVMALLVWMVVQFNTSWLAQLVTGGATGVVSYLGMLYLTNSGNIRKYMHELMIRIKK